MTVEHTELLAMILPPQGRLVVAATDSAGLLPGPGLVIALEHKAAAGSQTVAGLLDRERATQLYRALGDWLVATRSEPTQVVQPATRRKVAPGALVDRHGNVPTVQTLETADESTVAQWLASGADEAQL